MNRWIPSAFLVLIGCGAGTAPGSEAAIEIDLGSSKSSASAEPPPAAQVPSARSLLETKEEENARALAAIAGSQDAPSERRHPESSEQGVGLVIGGPGTAISPGEWVPKVVAGPIGSATVGAPSTVGSAPSNASAVVAGMRSGFRRCYNRGLASDPSMKGTVEIQVQVGPTGDVVKVNVVPRAGGTLSSEVMQCLSARASSAVFDPPGPAGASLTIPLSLTSV